MVPSSFNYRLHRFYLSEMHFAQWLFIYLVTREIQPVLN